MKPSNNLIDHSDAGTVPGNQVLKSGVACWDPHPSIATGTDPGDPTQVNDFKKINSK